MFSMLCRNLHKGDNCVRVTCVGFCVCEGRGGGGLGLEGKTFEKFCLTRLVKFTSVSKNKTYI